MPSRHATRLAAALTLVVAVLSSATPVLGHAELDTITPPDKSTTQGSPAEIVATFTEELDASASSLRIVDAANTVVAQGGEVSGGGTTLTLAITTPLSPGAYTVRWTSKSADDGDVDHGTTTFTVAGAASVAPSASAASSAPASVAPSGASIAASVAPSPSPGPSTPAASTSDALIPIVAVLVLLAVAGAWLLRGRSRAGR